MKLLKDKAFVNGEWISAKNQLTFNVQKPTNGEVIAKVPNMDAADAEAAIKVASAAFRTWQTTTGQDRSVLLKKWADLLNDKMDDIITILAWETGKIQVEAMLEAKGVPATVEFYAEEAKRIHGEIISCPVPGKKMFVEKQPLGVFGLISPWNFPVALSIRKVATAVAAGCTCVLKPAEDAPLSTLAAIQLAHEVGIPKGVINVITCDRQHASAVGKVMCQSPLIAGISFTGSTYVGKILYEQCAPFLKRISLELGGNGPFVVFHSADIDRAVEAGVRAKFRNCGQTCITINRFLIQEDVYEDFVNKFSERMKKIKPPNTLAPIINATQHERVCGLVEDARSKGANILLGGKPASEIGELYYEATLITGVEKNMRIYGEEIFGPVAAIMKFKTEEEAMSIANDTEKGLAAYLFSRDISQIFRVGKLLESGLVAINDIFTLTPIVPFGGIKESGIGKEGSRHGLDEFCYMKYICIGDL